MGTATLEDPMMLPDAGASSQTPHEEPAVKAARAEGGAGGSGAGSTGAICDWIFCSGEQIVVKFWHNTVQSCGLHTSVCVSAYELLKMC